jgi:hypothetical protein
MALGLDLTPVLGTFRQYDGNIAKTIVLKTNTSCMRWMLKLKDLKGRITMDQGYTGFTIVYNIKIRYFMTFKALKGDVFKVMIFDYIMTKVAKKCPKHEPILAMMDV